MSLGEATFPFPNTVMPETNKTIDSTIYMLWRHYSSIGYILKCSILSFSEVKSMQISHFSNIQSWKSDVYVVNENNVWVK